MQHVKRILVSLSSLQNLNNRNIFCVHLRTGSESKKTKWTEIDLRVEFIRIAQHYCKRRWQSAQRRGDELQLESGSLDRRIGRFPSLMTRQTDRRRDPRRREICLDGDNDCLSLSAAADALRCVLVRWLPYNTQDNIKMSPFIIPNHALGSRFKIILLAKLVDLVSGLY